VCLAPIIHDICEKSGCDFVVDVGTGLVGLVQYEECVVSVFN
jgi:hypothetical protein